MVPPEESMNPPRDAGASTGTKFAGPRLEPDERNCPTEVYGCQVHCYYIGIGSGIGAETCIASVQSAKSARRYAWFLLTRTNIEAHSDDVVVDQRYTAEVVEWSEPPR